MLIAISMFFVPSLSAAAITHLKADDIYLTPGGETIGIEIETNVVVIDTYSVKTNVGKVNPAKVADIRSGDILLNIDGIRIKDIDDLKETLMEYKNNQNKPMNILIKRNGRLLTKKVYPAKSKNDTLSLGLYLKDNVLGIGTLTFIYNNQQFGALGHQIKDRNNSLKEEELVFGKIKRAEVTSIKKSTNGKPGEKRAIIGKGEIGKVNNNTITGIYGNINTHSNLRSKNKLPIATQDEVKLGSAKIYTVINGNQIETFDVEIISAEKQSKKDIKGIKLRITDERLLSKTGGIIQGMSGSPIIQDGKIIGAVTHVLVDDTTVGYGVYIEFMLEELGIIVE
ncbi:SpoIVB peptidase [Haloplasma contractile]|uniref:SpoIVB peptidase protein n=1 Tax=Haloplasma contractile SSD-17B TaxID=1033810 RepID=U2FM11_9MOLU|nr:SpoIVB peptidase [Haloplasma contractile]ERJ13770.1 SpoIVB peptidase protein [Haloplasma contractile SSD-17B]